MANRVSKLTRLCTAYGTSEICLAPCLISKSKDDCQYLEFHTTYGMKMNPINDELYEAVVPRHQDRNIHAVFHSFPLLQEYRTNDLFTKHPSTEGLWLYHGRKDDAIVLSNGEKFNPINMEKHIEEHPLARRALVVGQARFQSALLLEPKWEILEETNFSDEKFIEQVWPHIEEANNIVASHGQILKPFIQIGLKSIPFATTPKGSIRRQTVINDYAEIIDDLYLRAEQVTGPSLPENSNIKDVQEFLLQIVSILKPDTAI